MDTLNQLMHGFAVAITPLNLMWALVGCFLGTAIGVLPGIGPALTVAMLLPLTATSAACTMPGKKLRPNTASKRGVRDMVCFPRGGVISYDLQGLSHWEDFSHREAKIQLTSRKDD